MPINKFGISVHSANDPDFLQWIHPTIPERPPYLNPQYRTGRWTMLDGVKSFSLRKVENGVHHGSQIYHDTESGNNRVYLTGAQVREQRSQAALIHGENSERVRKIGRETFKAYRQEGHDYRTYGTKKEFNGYIVKSKWKIVDYQTAEHNEEVLELTGDRTGNTIDEDLKFHFTRFEGNADEALKDAERYRYYFKLASINYNPKVDKATHRNSKRFWDRLRAEEQRRLENELLENDANIEIEIPQNDVENGLSTIAEESSVSTDAESDSSAMTLVDASMEVNVDLEQKVSFSKTFSDDSIKSLSGQPSSITVNEYSDSLYKPNAPGILASSLILGKVVTEAEDSIVFRKRSRVPRNLMNSYNSSSSSLSKTSFQKIDNSIATSGQFPPPPPSFITPPAQPLLVTAPTSITFDYSEAPTITPPTPFLNSNLNKIDEMLEEVNGMSARVASKLASRNTPPPIMLSLAEPDFKSINIEEEDVWEDSKEDLQAQNEEYHEGAEIDAKTIEKLQTSNSRHKKARRSLEAKINTLQVAGSAMNVIIYEILQKFVTPRFDMDLSVSESHSSTKKRPKVIMSARKTNKSDSNCLLTPACSTDSLSRCTHCELQWAASIMAVIWSDAMQTTDMTETDFLIDHFNPRTLNGPPPDYFSKPGEITLTELEVKKPSIKRGCESQEASAACRRRIDSEEIDSADNSIDRESLEIKREVVITHRVRTESDDSDVDMPEVTDDWLRLTVPEFIELPESETDN